MIEPTFKQLFGLRQAENSQIIEQYAGMTAARFDYEDGLPVVISSYDSYERSDLPLLLAALARSDTSLAPIVVDNAPELGAVTEIAERMGALTIGQSERGQLGAQRAGIHAALEKFPASPILMTDDDCIPQKYWATTMLDHLKLDTEGGMLYGGVVLEHGPSFAADALRTTYAFSTDLRRKVTNSTPKARGTNSLLLPDTKGRILANIEANEADVFPCDVALQECVLAAGGSVTSTLHPRAVMFTRGDRFASVMAIAKDLVGRGRQRAALYQSENMSK